MSLDNHRKKEVRKGEVKAGRRSYIFFRTAAQDKYLAPV